MSFGRFERSRGDVPLSEINVTPLVDVMLVLLVIFMLTAPLLTSSLQLELPRAAGVAGSASATSLTLEVNQSGQTFPNGQPLDAGPLARRLAEAAAADPDTELQLRADQAVPYGRVVELMGVAQKAGLSRMGFVAQSETPASAGR